jgi:hypothetical protein
VRGELWIEQWLFEGLTYPLQMYDGESIPMFCVLWIFIGVPS